jgi:NAD(P)-dependent dehydrogenase (short-subunit alcohol dehydrogenase family)
MGSITLARAASALPAPAYKISKAAMNALTVQYALEYEKEGFSFIALCPGVCALSFPSGTRRALLTLALLVAENRSGWRRHG